MKWTLYVVILIIAAIGIAVFILPKWIDEQVFTRENLCEVKIIEQLQDSNKKFTVYLYELDCGAVASSTINVSMVPSKEKLDSVPGNIFSSRLDPTAKYGIAMSPNRILSVFLGSSKEHPYKELTNFKGIRVKYQLTERPHNE